MTFRTELLKRLSREVLGPRNGVRENLATRNPVSEYITGVLAPTGGASEVLAPEGELSSLTGLGNGGSYGPDEEDLSGGDWEAWSPMVAPSLDPKSLPASMGISCVVSAPDGVVPEIEICATWARYTPTSGQPEQDSKVWLRKPAYMLTGPHKCQLPVKEFRSGQNDDGATEEVRLLIRISRCGEDAANSCKVSVFLSNMIQPQNPDRATPSEHIFQPQIRIICLGQTSLITYEREKALPDSTDPHSMAWEDNNLSLLYRERRAYARGHLCGAVWREVDPERSWTDEQGQEQESPFRNEDLVCLPAGRQQAFAACDVRSDFLPMYQVNAPSTKWPSTSDRNPEFSALKLAQAWESEAMKACLEPLISGYKSWIEEQKKTLPKAESQLRRVAEQNLQDCVEQLDRMNQGMLRLLEDKDARLAFCFANQVMQIQSIKKLNGRDLSWRPFQLAFILLNIESFADESSSDRDICDLLWFPTGGGKTEAYLGLIAYVLGLRRLKYGQSGAGTAVISRYTLRLLTIQQYRRALSMITACEYLRVMHLDQPHKSVGWRPDGYKDSQAFLWGTGRFSAGLWVGAGVTPNSLESMDLLFTGGEDPKYIAGALEQLQGICQGYQGPVDAIRKNAKTAGDRLQSSGEPAQITSCPFCHSLMAIPDKGLEHSQSLFIPARIPQGWQQSPESVMLRPGKPDIQIQYHLLPGQHTVRLDITINKGVLKPDDLNRWWWKLQQDGGPECLAASPARPGYHILRYKKRTNGFEDSNFDLYCPDPECELNRHAWAETVPMSLERSHLKGAPYTPLYKGNQRYNALPRQNNLDWQTVPEYFRPETCHFLSSRIPIPAMTVDDQVYAGCPSLLLATVDKFARLAYEPRAGSLFGNVEFYHSRSGYYRKCCPPEKDRDHPPEEALRVAVSHFRAPELILQDELHLIEGPLGTITGLFETAIDELCSFPSGEQIIRPKYIASSATVRQAGTQVQALYNRRLSQFPAWALLAQDRFFAREEEEADPHPALSRHSGRLYVGIAAPGQGPLTPIVRIWSALLQGAWELAQSEQYSDAEEVDNFWTLAGYFNAIRELAGAQTLFRQDIPERLKRRAEELGQEARRLPADAMELSSRCNSTELPSMLEELSNSWEEQGMDAVMATSMFGTGVDVDRLGLMVVHGQPKTTAAYIQATGRVGRRRGALVVTFLRASRPRDLDHYEQFTGYHRALYRHVEPVTVAPFSPRAREKALGPALVSLLRQARSISWISVPEDWRIQQKLKSSEYRCEAARMKDHAEDAEIMACLKLFKERAEAQPEARRPDGEEVRREIAGEIDKWRMMASRLPESETMLWWEGSLLQVPRHTLVLGNQHTARHPHKEVFHNSPTSMRDVEATTTFEV